MNRADPQDLAKMAVVMFGIAHVALFLATAVRSEAYRRHVQPPRWVRILAERIFWTFFGMFIAISATVMMNAQEAGSALTPAYVLFPAIVSTLVAGYRAAENEREDWEDE